ncbi:MAG: STAS domain-containing protein [Mycolicibacterium sp.]|nr:STAS domain-containing protein [Mycolicibacterium sp.]
MDSGDYPSFGIHQSRGADGVVRLFLIGDLDLVSKDQLELALRRLRAARSAVLVDLSRIEFLDSSGLRSLLTAVVDAREDGWTFTIAPTVPFAVRRIVDIVGVADILWPESDEAT